MSGKLGSTSVVDGYGIELDVAVDGERRGAALHAVAVALEVDAPELVGDELAVVGVERRVRVEMDHGRRAAVRGREHQRVDGDLALLEVPVRPHRAVADDVARRRVMSIVSGMPSMRPEPRGPGPGRDDDLLADLDRILRSSRLPRRSRRRVTSKPVTSTPFEHRDPFAEALVAQAEHGLDVEREAALVLVEADGHALRAPVGEERLHVRVDLGLADDQLRAVADPLLPLECSREIGLLHLRAECDVADRVVVVRSGIRLPHLDARLHELAHRRLEVVVADDAARDPGCAGAGLGLVDDDDVGARAGAPCTKLLGEVVGGRQSVDAGADDDVWSLLRSRHLLPPDQHCCRWVDGR